MIRAALAFLALVLSGAGTALVSPPLHWTWLHPFVWVPALWVLLRARRRATALAGGWLAGFAAQLALFHWLAYTVGEFSNLPRWLALCVLVLFAALTGLWLGVFGLGLARVRRASGSMWPLGLAVWFTAVEFLSPQMFPYQQGVGWYRHPSIFLVVALTGPAGLTFLVVGANALVVQAIEVARGREPARALARSGLVWLALAAGAAGYSRARLARIEAQSAEAPILRAALVQPGWELEELRRGDFRTSLARVANDLAGLAQSALRERGPVDAVVLPETVLGDTPAAPEHAALRRLAREHGVEVWTGAAYQEFLDETGAPARRPEEVARTRRFNSAFRIDPRGHVDRRYDKIVRVPFGEYVPFERWLPFLRGVQGIYHLDAGNESFVYEDSPWRPSFLICYEAIRPALVRRVARLQPGVLVNVTYDGWYGQTSEPSQHLMLAAVQAAANGLPLLRCTTTGISAAVDAAGRVLAHSGLSTREVLVTALPLARVPAPYTRIGDAFAWICVAASGLLLLRGRPDRDRARV